MCPLVSDEVLGAVSCVLKLNDAEREYLQHIARPSRGKRSSGSTLRGGVVAMLDALTDVPAFVLGPRMDILAASFLGEVILALPADQRNVAVQVFFDPGARDYYLQWETVAREAVAHLRRLSAIRPDGGLMRQLIGGLTIQSPDFARI